MIISDRYALLAVYRDEAILSTRELDGILFCGQQTTFQLVSSAIKCLYLWVLMDVADTRKGN